MSIPPSPAPELQILLLSDGRPGHYHLAEGVVAAIARRRAVNVTRREVRRPGWLPGRLLPGLVRLGPRGRSLVRRLVGLAECLPATDLVISAGGETMAANAVLAGDLGVPNIFCGSLRRLAPEAFSLVVSSYARHANVPRHVVTLKPSGFDPDTLRGGTKPQALTGPPATIGLLIGGDSGLFRYAPGDWQRLVAFLSEAHAALGTRWIVSTSRRSPDTIGDAMAELARRPDSPILEFIDFRSAGPGTLPQLFAAVDAIVCTEDSSTMTDLLAQRDARVAYAHEATDDKDLLVLEAQFAPKVDGHACEDEVPGFAHTLENAIHPLVAALLEVGRVDGVVDVEVGVHVAPPDLDILLMSHEARW